MSVFIPLSWYLYFDTHHVTVCISLADLMEIYDLISGRRAKTSWTRDAEEERENWTLESRTKEKGTGSYQKGNKGQSLRYSV